MKSINKIIKEEVINFLKENSDYDYDYINREDEIKHWMFNDFLYKNTPDFSKKIPWRLVPYPRLKKIWEDYIRTGVVRDSKGIEMIGDIMISNAIKISVITNLAGHTQWGDEETFEDNIGYWVNEQLNCILPEKQIDTNQLEIPFNDPSKGNVKKEPSKIEPCNVQIHPFAQEFINENFDSETMNKEDIRGMLYDAIKDKFFDYVEDPKTGQLYISDYGLKALESLSYELNRTTEPEQKVTVIDKMLNVVHQRSDMAAWFVEGGSRALSQLSGYGDDEGESVISGKYKMSDY
jgi:hypothetical protein